MAVKVLRALLGFVSMSDGDVLSRGMAVLTGLTGNAKFPNPPVDLATLKTAVESFQATIADALDGGKKAIAARNKQRAVVIQMLRQLATYVEANCNQDVAVFTSSGFDVASATRTTTPQPLSQPGIRNIAHGTNSGQLVVRITALPKARSYEMRYGALVNGAVPGQWTTVTITSVRGGVPVDNLTPGVTYVFQVRALGNQGYTDWSDLATRMSV
jgi:hypothetical protein